MLLILKLIKKIYMRNILSLFTAVSVLILLSCNTTDKKSTSTSTVNPDNIDSADSIDKLKIEFIGTENLTISNARLKVSLYGTEENIADASATLITEQEFERKSIPFTIELPVPKDAESKINPKPTSPAKYYITVSWDSDGNGKAGEKGDIFIDYDKQFPNVELKNETQKIYLKKLK